MSGTLPNRTCSAFGVRLASFITAAAMFAVGGCHDSDGNAPPPPAAVAPSISSQPVDQTVTSGTSANFSVTAAGTAPLSYQWQRDSVAIAGATASSYSLSGTALSDSGAKFRVVVTNAAGAVTSSAATLTVTAPGQTVHAASGGEVSSSDGKLHVMIAANVLSGDTTFNVTPLSSLSNLPANYALVSGTAYEIDYSGAGFTGPASVTLRFADPNAAPAQKIHSATRAGARPRSDPTPISSAVVQCADQNQVYQTSVDPQASDYSDTDAVLCSPTSTVGLVQGDANVVLPSITAQPAAVSVTVGDTATFSVTATGTAPFYYQWSRDGVIIADATAPSYSLIVTAADDGATFSVTVTSNFGRVVSTAAKLTVGPPVPPPAPIWNPIKPVGTASALGIGLPLVGIMVDTPFVAWNNNGVLDSDDPTVHGFAHTIFSTPQVLSGPNYTIGYIVFVDDDHSSCPSRGMGNTLSAIALGYKSETGLYTPSSPFPLYHSDTDCIVSFSSGLSPEQTSGVGVAFAAQETDSLAIKVGVNGSFHPGSVVNGVTTTDWVPTMNAAATLQASAECSNAPFGALSGDAMMGVLQAPHTLAPPLSAATFAFVAAGGSGAKVCAASLSGSVWSAATKVFDNGGDAEPAVALDPQGNALVFASLIQVPAASVRTYAMTSSYYDAGSATWQTPQPLDSSNGVALPSLGFDANGNAFAAWRPAVPSSIVYGTRRSNDGNWEQVQRLSELAALDTRYPRLCVDPSGSAVLLFEQNYANFQGSADPASFRVFSKYWKRGLWSDVSQVQTGNNDGRFAACPRNANLANLEIVWRETDAADAKQPATPQHYSIISDTLNAP